MAEAIDGQTPACSTCRFWSDLIAETKAGGPLLALCLGSAQPQEMRPGTYHCAAWRDAPYGSIDELRDEPDPYTT